MTGQLGEAVRGSASGGIAIVVRDAAQLQILLEGGRRLAASRRERLALLVLSETTAPDWALSTEQYAEAAVDAYFLDDREPVREIRHWLREHDPDLIGFVYDPVETGGRYTLDKQLDALLAEIKCPVALVDGRADKAIDGLSPSRILLPFSSDENSLFAIRGALEINPIAQLTVVGTGPAPIDEADRIAQKEMFIQSLEQYADHPRVTPRLLLGDNAIKRLIKGSSAYDSVLLGASRGNSFVRAMLGDRLGVGITEAGQRVIKETDLPYIILREYQGWLGSRLALAIKRSEDLLPAVTEAERIDIYKEVRRAARPKIDFFVMTALSAAIASFGLLLNSAAVVIGAMLIAPLMSAIIGMGLAMVQGDTRFLLTSTAAAGRGALVATLAGVLIGLLNFEHQLTSEMLSRAGPNLFDLAVAILSGAAAAYALCRKDVSSSLPGVAISVALVPPLATLGLFLGNAQWAHAYGAFLLFVTNLTAISFSCGIVFTMVGFRPAQFSDNNLSRVLTFKRSFFVLGLIILGVISNLTFLSVEKKLQETSVDQVQQIITDFLEQDINRDVFLIRMDVQEGKAGYDDVQAIVSSSTAIRESETRELANRLAEHRGRPVRLSVVTAPLMKSQSVSEPPRKQIQK